MYGLVEILHCVPSLRPFLLWYSTIRTIVMKPVLRTCIYIFLKLTSNITIYVHYMDFEISHSSYLHMYTWCVSRVQAYVHVYITLIMNLSILFNLKNAHLRLFWSSETWTLFLVSWADHKIYFLSLYKIRVRINQYNSN